MCARWCSRLTGFTFAWTGSAFARCAGSEQRWRGSCGQHWGGATPSPRRAAMLAISPSPFPGDDTSHRSGCGMGSHPMPQAGGPCPPHPRAGNPPPRRPLQPASDDGGSRPLELPAKNADACGASATEPRVPTPRLRRANTSRDRLAQGRATWGPCPHHPARRGKPLRPSPCAVHFVKPRRNKHQIRRACGARRKIAGPYPLRTDRSGHSRPSRS